MRQPQFWYQKPGLKAWMLAPIAAIWDQAAKTRLRRSCALSAGVPVICIGNVNVGGTGKTPMTIALAQRLSEAGRKPHIVTRGYGGDEPGPVLVDERRHSSSNVGDEPLLLAAFAPTWVARDRLEGARQAAEAGATEILLDDGHQYPRLARDLTILTVNAAVGFGNEKVMPAGPLREELARGLSRADVLVVVGSLSNYRVFQGSNSGKLPLPTTRAELRPLKTGIDWEGLDVVAFAGIGQPDSFYQTVAALGAKIKHSIALGDHQPLDGRLMRRLETVARNRNAQLVTTEKDAVRLSREWRSKVLTIPVRMKLDSWELIDRRLHSTGILGTE